MEKSRLGIWLGKAVVFAWAFTAVILLLLAFFMLKSGMSVETAAKIIPLCYIGGPFLGAFYLGKKVGQKRFLWGILTGISYFAVFLLISLFLGNTDGNMASACFRVFLMTAAGGLAGGMLS